MGMVGKGGEGAEGQGLHKGRGNGGAEGQETS